VATDREDRGQENVVWATASFFELCDNIDGNQPATAQSAYRVSEREIYSKAEAMLRGKLYRGNVGCALQQSPVMQKKMSCRVSPCALTAGSMARWPTVP